MTHLLLTVRFLDDRYHGLLDRGGPSEWPPSPFRLFQALVAGVARRGELVVGDDVPSNTNFTPIGQALGWLQQHTREHPPIIIAPKSKPGQAITRFAPNNDGDKKFDRQERLTSKHTEPTLFLLEPDQQPEIHYAWPLNGAKGCPVADLERAARSLTTLGWGIDMAFADARLAAEAELQTLKGIRWYPKKNAGSFRDTLRTPAYDDELGECTLCDLRHCHSTFINRIEHGKPLKTVDKPKVFDRVLYTSTERPASRPFRLFELRNLDGSRFRYPHGRLIHIAGMVRHLAIEAMKTAGLPRGAADDWIETYVAGHRKGRKADLEHEQKCKGATDIEMQDKAALARQREAFDGTDEHRQLSYIPLPSVGKEYVDPGIRRVMIVAPVGDDALLDLVARRLGGQQLKALNQKNAEFGVEENGQPKPGPLLVPLPRSGDGVTRRYTATANVWHSFTPVILPGHDDRKPEKTRKLILKALSQSGIDQPCEFEWSAFSRFAKSYSAHKYVRDENSEDGKRRIGYIRPGHLLDQTAVHLTIRFGRREDPSDPDSRWIAAEQPIPGPLILGAGRHCGFGLMAAVGD